MIKNKSSNSKELQISLFSPNEAPDAFRKAVQVVHSKAKSPLSLVQRKLANAWLKHAIESHSSTDGWWEIGIGDLAKLIGFDSNNRKYLKESAEAIMKIVFEWDVLASTNKRVAWKASVLFPEIEIHSDIIRYQISSQMREQLTNPDMYALIDMKIVKRFRRASSLAIWEFCVRFEKIGLTAEVEWQKFRDMALGESADAKTYKEYKYFKSKVLVPAVAEINAESNHVVSLVESKLGRCVDKVRFTVKKKNNVLETLADDRMIELVGELVRLGLPQSEAKKICNTHEPGSIKAAIEYTKQRVNNKKLAKIDKPAAYFRLALANGYAAHSTIVSTSVSPANNNAKSINIKETYRAHQIAEAEKYFNELDATDQAGAISKYNEQQTVPSLRLLTKRASKAAQTGFFGWLATETWGEPTTEELLNFAQQIIASQERA